MTRIESMMEEPVDLASRMQARGLTREGIQAFEEGALQKHGPVSNRRCRLFLATRP